MGAVWSDFNPHFQHTIQHTLNTRFKTLNNVDMIAVLVAINNLQMKHTDMTCDFHSTICDTLSDVLFHLSERETKEILQM